MHPAAGRGTCHGPIVRAHTIQRTGGLTRIARNGHVYQFVPDLIQLERNQGVFTPTLVGVKDASTFMGFCHYHDSETFAPIERNQLQFIPEHMYLLAYRAACRELHAKLGVVSALEHFRDIDRGRSLEEQIDIQSSVFLHELGTRSGLKDIEVFKTLLDEILETREFDNVDFFALELNRCPDVLCSTGTTPDSDFQGQVLQDLGGLTNTLQILTFSIVATDTGGAVVFAWLRTPQSPSEKLVRSFLRLPDELKHHALVRYAFCSTDNLAISPAWWEALSPDNRESLQRYLHYGADPSFPMPDYRDDGLRVVDWEFVGQHSSLELP